MSILHEDANTDGLKGTEQEIGIYIDLDTHLCTWQREVMPRMRTW